MSSLCDDNPADPVHEVVEHAQFEGCEFDRRTIVRGLARRGVECEASMRQLRRCHAGCPADQGLEARCHLGNMERLGHVIVGAGIQSVDFFRPSPPRSEDQDRKIPVLAPPSLQNLNSLHLRQAQIEDNGVECVVHPEGETIRTVEGVLNGKARLGKTLAKPLCDFSIVFHQ